MKIKPNIDKKKLFFNKVFKIGSDSAHLTLILIKLISRLIISKINEQNDGSSRPTK